MPMRFLGAALMLLATLIPRGGEPSGRDRQESLSFGGRERAYRVFVPDGIGKSGPAPAVVLFNGSGSSVEPLMKYWKDVARKDGVVVIGPGASESGAGAFRKTRPTSPVRWSRP